MNRYLFIFGYETPEQFEYNSDCGTDNEDSIAFFLEAPDESTALRRGREIAAQFARRLFSSVGIESPWSADNYANWIEHRPLDRFSGLALDTLDVVGVNETPDYDEWIGGGFRGEIKP